MKTFQVYGYLTISAFAEVKAETEEMARENARGLSVPSLCHQCSSAGEDESDAWELNGFDDPPNDAVQSIEEIKS